MKPMKCFIACLVCLSYISCSSTPEWKKQLASADSLVINFNVPNSNTIEKTVNTTEKKAIKQISGFFKNKSAAAYKCGYDGNIIFYQEGKLTADVSFNYSGEGCRHFITRDKDSLITSVMNNDAADFLKSLREGKNWY